MVRLILASLMVCASGVNSTAQQPAAPIKMRIAEFRDINMDNVVAYTMLVPDGWKAEGHIEWSNQRTPYPQTKIAVTAADNSRIAFVPAMTFHYSEASKLAIDEAAAAGIPLIIPRQSGEAPPKKLGEWLMTFIAKYDTTVKNLKLVEDNRDKAAEEAMAKLVKAQNNSPVVYEVHLIKFTFDLEGVAFTQDVNITYACNPIFQTRNINMQDWMLFVTLNVRAPSAKYATLKPLLYASAQSLRPVPKWWTQQQLLLMEITRQNHEIGMEQIKQRGRMYDQMSDASFAAWKKQQAISDAKQNDRINSIYEVQDFQDPNGCPVKLPIHYKYYYSDGKGNYIMTNSSTAPPGTEWKPLKPMK